MFRKISFLLLFTSSFLLSGCIDVLEEITLNRDGSGSYLIRYDLSSMLTDPTMRAMFEESMTGEGGEGMGSLDNIDSTLSVYDNLGPDVENREFWKKVTVHMVMNASTNEYKIDFLLDFTSVADIAYMYENLASVAGESQSFAQVSSILPMSPQFTQTKNSLIRKNIAVEGEEEENEDMSMVEMFFSEAKYTCIYHMPGKVSKAKIPKAKIDGNTVTIENSLLDALKGEAKLDGTIKYK